MMDMVNQQDKTERLQVDCDQNITVLIEPNSRRIGPFGSSNLSDGGAAWIETFQAEPRKLLDMLNRWFDLMMNSSGFLQIANEGALGLFFKEVKDHFLEYSEVNGIIVLWCDAMLRNVDPTPLIELFEYYEKNVCVRSFLLEKSRKLPRKEEELTAARNAFQFKSSKTHALSIPHLHDALVVIGRIRQVANLEYHRKLKNGPPHDSDLVTADDIAKIVHLEKRSLERYRKEWPKPDVRGKGSRAERWVFARIRSVLAGQFPDQELPYIPFGTERKHVGISLHT